MHILQAKVRCLKEIVDSGWFKPGRNVTILQGKKEETVSQLLRGLEALNPLYDIVLVDPLGDHLRTWQQGEHKRYVIQQKKTSVYTIFDSEPELVKGLAALDELFLETDRIELGRRLDYSRWISFVELPASARWSDIAADMHTLRNHRNRNREVPHGADETFFSHCKPTDRIKGDLAARCRAWLLSLPSDRTGDSAGLSESCLQEVNLHERFRSACRVIDEYLPPMVRLHPETQIKEKYSFTEIFSATSGKDPLTPLLKRLSNRFSLASLKKGHFDRIRNAVADAAASCPPLSTYNAALTIDENGFSLAGPVQPDDSRIAKRRLLIWAVALLTQILWERFPIFLLDRYDEDLSAGERCELAQSIVELGLHSQIFLSPYRLNNLQDYGSAKILNVTVDGLVQETGNDSLPDIGKNGQ